VLKDPTQIKSAVGNSGDFAPADKGMNKADGGPVRFADGGEAGVLLGGLGDMMREYAPEANDLAAHVAEKGGVTYSPVTGDLHQAGTVTATDPSRTVALDSAPHAQEIHDFLMQNQDVLGEDPAAVLHITSDDKGNHFLHVAKHTPHIPEIGAALQANKDAGFAGKNVPLQNSGKSWKDLYYGHADPLLLGGIAGAGALGAAGYAAANRQ
jgi:hypothetical protein